MLITLTAPGSWTIRVNNPGGGQSNTFGFNVNAAQSTPKHRFYLSSVAAGERQ